MTPQQFKERWDSSDDGNGITFADIAECAASWGVTNCQNILPTDAVRYLVLKAAGVSDAEDYPPTRRGTK